MKDFIEELKYMCSSSNTKSRGLYIFITIFLCIMLIAIPATLILFIVNLVKGFFNPLFLILMIVALVIFVGLIVWLKKS